jgi:aerobic-type carbon monoxide dehydrogenase small subunit (CoxS/CutS family)
VRLELALNGTRAAVDVDAGETLVGVLRRLGLSSVRETCGIGVCGSCTVLVDGAAMSACLLLAPLVDGREVTTAEGLDGDPVVDALSAAHAYQCGWCTPGFAVAIRDLLDRNPRPTREESVAALAGNLCRCGSYLKILDAVERAAEAPARAPNGRG